MVGRERELALAERFLGDLRVGAAALAIVGDPGIGKTVLLREIVDRAADRSYTVLSCRPAEAETRLAFVSLGDLLADIAEDIFANLRGVQRWALEGALLRRELDGGLIDPRAISAALVSTLVALSREHPTLVAIDDAQWLDAPSARALEFAARRVGAARIGFLISVRAGAVLLPLGLERAFSDEQLGRVSLGHLSLGALHRLLAARLASPLARPVLLRIERASGGNPFFALEIARALAAAPTLDPGGPLPVPASLRELVADRVAALSRAGQDALLVAAAVAHPTVELVERASSAPGLAAVEEAGVVRVNDDRVSFAHPLYASAVYIAAATGRRRRLHLRLADLVAGLDERAWHLALGADRPSEDVAAQLEEAATHARARGAWDNAAELLERARGLTPPDKVDEGWRRSLLAAECQVHAGDRPRGRTLIEGVLAEDPPAPVRAQALCLLGEISDNEERPDQTKRLFSLALEHTDDPRLKARIENGIALVTSHHFDFAAAFGHSCRALELAEASADSPLIAEALSSCAMYGFLSGRGVDWAMIERSLELEDPDRLVPLQQRPSTVAAVLAMYVGRRDAREQLLAVGGTMIERGDESDLGFVLMWQCWLERRSGDLAAAAASADEATRVAQLAGSQTVHAWALAQRAFVHAYRGEVAQTRQACAGVAELIERVGPAQMLLIAGSLAVLALSLDDPAAAWETCEPLTVALEEHGIGEPVPLEFLPDALEALIMLGQLDRAEALIDTFESRARELDRAWALATAGRSRALLLAARGDLDGAATALKWALGEHQRLEMPFELARTLLVQGQVRRRRREKRLARESLARSLQLFESIGAPLWAQQARSGIERLGVRTAPGGLSETEQRVAELAAAGMTNKQIAARLFVSPRTVQANLARVYEKLSIGSRAELGARMNIRGEARASRAKHSQTDT